MVSRIHLILQVQVALILVMIQRVVYNKAEYLKTFPFLGLCALTLR